jgi:hypothetical protein
VQQEASYAQFANTIFSQQRNQDIIDASLQHGYIAEAFWYAVALHNATHTSWEGLNVVQDVMKDCLYNHLVLLTLNETSPLPAALSHFKNTCSTSTNSPLPMVHVSTGRNHCHCTNSHDTPYIIHQVVKDLLRINTVAYTSPDHALAVEVAHQIIMYPNGCKHLFPWLEDSSLCTLYTSRTVIMLYRVQCV